jgi:hypothetical protein
MTRLAVDPPVSAVGNGWVGSGSIGRPAEGSGARGWLGMRTGAPGSGTRSAGVLAVSASLGSGGHAVGGGVGASATVSSGAAPSIDLGVRALRVAGAPGICDHGGGGDVSRVGYVREPAVHRTSADAQRLRNALM